MKNKDFFAQCCNEAKSLDPDEINHLLETNVGERWLKPSTTRKVLRTLAAIQKEYDSVVNTLSESGPLVLTKRLIYVHSIVRPDINFRRSVGLCWSARKCQCTLLQVTLSPYFSDISSLPSQFVDRYFKVSETIADALVALGDDLKRIATYDRLFGTSAILEDVLCQSYVEILHFWNRVFRELHRPSED